MPRVPTVQPYGLMILVILFGLKKLIHLTLRFKISLELIVLLLQLKIEVLYMVGMVLVLLMILQ